MRQKRGYKHQSFCSPHTASTRLINSICSQNSIDWGYWGFLYLRSDSLHCIGFQHSLSGAWRGCGESRVQCSVRLCQTPGVWGCDPLCIKLTAAGQILSVWAPSPANVPSKIGIFCAMRIWIWAEVCLWVDIKDNISIILKKSINISNVSSRRPRKQ